MFRDVLWYTFRGSVSRSAAWAPLPGAFLVWLAFWLMGISQTVPETLPGTIVFFVICAVAAWLMIVLARLLYAPYHFLAKANAEQILLAKRIADRVQININGVNFDGRNSTFTGISVTLVNGGAHTTLTNWRASYCAEGRATELKVANFRTDKIVTSYGPLGTVTMTDYDQYGNCTAPQGHIQSYETLKYERLEPGGSRTGYLSLLKTKGAVPLEYKRGAVIEVMAQDEQGRIIQASHVLKP